MRAAAYARVSSSIQRERETIASQLRVLPEFIARQGWTLVKSYADDGHSAKAGNLGSRKGLADLLRDAASGAFDVVVVVDIDRLTRSEDLGERGHILGALQRAKVKIASAMSGQVLDLSTSSGDLFTSLHAFFAAEWTRKHRARVSEGRVTAVTRNHKPAGKPPFWVRWNRFEKVWVVNEERMAAAREIFERVAAGESARTIADDFHRRDVSRPSGEWTRSRVHRMVRNRSAVGEWVVDRTRGLTLTIPAPVDEDLWQRANQAMHKMAKRGLRKTRHEYLFEGLGVCARCGAPMGIRSAVWDPRRNGRWSPAAYQCRARRIFRIGTVQCAAAHVLTADGDARGWAAIARELEDPGLAQEIAGELEGQAGDAAAWKRDADGYRDHIARLERVEEGVLARYRRGLVSDAVVDGELGRISRERDAVRGQLASAEQAIAAATGTSERLDAARRMLGDMRAVLNGASFADRRRLVELLVPVGGIVFDGARLKITLLVPRSSAPGLVARSESETPHETRLKIRVVA
jgi:DNA invertase Pin-like site-specific DNA recombinase